jgi:hypothetical protein
MRIIILPKVCVKEEWTFLYCFILLTNFRKPRRSHVIARGIFAPRFGRVATQNDGWRCPTDILTRLVNLCSFIEIVDCI